MTNEFMSLTELGRLYGVSSHAVGQWLTTIGLRTPKKKPSAKAHQGGYVDQRGSTQPGTYFWVWHAERTMRVLDDAGFKTPVGQGIKSPATE